MTRTRFSLLLVPALLAVACWAWSGPKSGPQTAFPDPAVDVPQTDSHQKQSIVLAGGCFWGIEGLFERVKGVTDAVSGFAGGDKATAHYERVSEGNTGHAESVKVTYDPSKITLGQILKVYFAVGHDPTELNRQGPDTGTQYRSAIFYADDEQKRIAEAYIKQLDDAKIYAKPIVTQVVALKGFYPAEAYHQHFLQNNPTYPYILVNDMPKLAALKKQLPQLCKR